MRQISGSVLFCVFLGFPKFAGCFDGVELCIIVLYSRFFLFFGSCIESLEVVSQQHGPYQCCWNFQVKYHQCLTAGGKMYCDPGMVDQAFRFPGWPCMACCM